MLNEKGNRFLKAIFESGTVPIESPLPVSCIIMEKDRASANVEVYLIDLDAISVIEKQCLVTLIAKRFKKPREQIYKWISKTGFIPLRTHLCSGAAAKTNWYFI